MARKNDGSSTEFALWLMKLYDELRKVGFNDKALAILDFTAWHKHFLSGETPENAVHEEMTCS